MMSRGDGGAVAPAVTEERGAEDDALARPRPSTIRMISAYVGGDLDRRSGHGRPPGRTTRTRRRQQARAAEEGEDGEQGAGSWWVDVEVTTQAAGDTGDVAVGVLRRSRSRSRVGAVRRGPLPPPGVAAVGPGRGRWRTLSRSCHPSCPSPGQAPSGTPLILVRGPGVSGSVPSVAPGARDATMSGYEPHRWPRRRGPPVGSCGLPRHGRAVARRRGCGTRPAPRAPVLWIRMGFLAGRLRRLRRGAVRRPVDVPARPAAHPDAAPGLDAATRQGKRASRQDRRLADYGPLVAVGAIALGVLLLVTLATGQSLAFGPLLLAAPAWRCCGGRPTRPSGSGGRTRRDG